MNKPYSILGKTLGIAALATAIVLPARSESIVPTDRNSADVLRLTILDKTTNRPIANRATSIYSDNGIRCIKDPCPTNGQNWQGRTDRQGVVLVPQKLIQKSTTLTVKGYISTSVRSDESTILLSPAAR